MRYMYYTIQSAVGEALRKKSGKNKDCGET